MSDHEGVHHESGQVRTKKPSVRVPSYRRRRDSDQAIVTLSDAVTKKRRDYWLGPHGSAESRERYFNVIAQWEAAGRRLPPPKPGSSRHNTADDSRIQDRSPTINAIILDYWNWAKDYYSPSELSSQKSAFRLLRQLYGTIPATDFGPSNLRLLRDLMVRGARDPVTGEQIRVPWSRKHVNGQVHRLCAMFKWAASHELLPVATYQQLKTIPALRRGRTKARENDPVRPVPLECIEAVKPFLNRQVKALIDLQLLTGARGGELFNLRSIDITMNDRTGIWEIDLADHKTAHHGHRRTIFLGPKAQSVIRPFLSGRPVDAFLFSPTEAEQERLAKRAADRTTPLSCGNVPGSNRVTTRRRPPGSVYTSSSYRRAIERACDKAFLHPHIRPASRAGLTDEQREELARWRKEHRWTPHQLRHTAATTIRREFGLEAARIALGHSSALVTDAVYAERDTAKVVEVMRKIG